MPGDISFEHPGWSLLPEPPAKSECAWTNNQGLIITLHHLGLDRALRNRMQDVKAVRDHYRVSFGKQGMGLIECDVLQLQGVQAVRAIAKLVLPQKGAAYAGTVALPLPKESYVFNTVAKELGITGIREAAVMLKISTEFEKQGYALDLPVESGQQSESVKAPIAWKNAATGAMIHWAQDPYEPEFKGPSLRNLADGAEHDAGLPEHPLSRVRAALQCLTEGLTLSGRLKQRAVGRKRWLPW
jgi:hypothetical protein